MRSKCKRGGCLRRQCATSIFIYFKSRNRVLFPFKHVCYHPGNNFVAHTYTYTYTYVYVHIPLFVFSLFFLLLFKYQRLVSVLFCLFLFVYYRWRKLRSLFVFSPYFWCVPGRAVGGPLALNHLRINRVAADNRVYRTPSSRLCLSSGSDSEKFASFVRFARENGAVPFLFSICVRLVAVSSSLLFPSFTPTITWQIKIDFSVRSFLFLACPLAFMCQPPSLLSDSSFLPHPNLIFLPVPFFRSLHTKIPYCLAQRA